MRRPLLLLLIGAANCSAPVAAAWAAEGVLPELTPSVTAKLPLRALPTSGDHGAFAASHVLSDLALGRRRGGTAVAQLQGTVSGNSATNVQTGSNSIAEGSFVGAAGITTVVQNTGNNVLIQSSTVVNLQLK